MVENIIIIAVVAVIVGLSTLYIIRAKKSGQKCIGCPSSKECSGACSSCSCSCSGKDK